MCVCVRSSSHWYVRSLEQLHSNCDPYEVGCFFGVGCTNPRVELILRMAIMLTYDPKPMISATCTNTEKRAFFWQIALGVCLAYARDVVFCGSICLPVSAWSNSAREKGGVGYVSKVRTRETECRRVDQLRYGLDTLRVMQGRSCGYAGVGGVLSCHESGGRVSRWLRCVFFSNAKTKRRGRRKRSLKRTETGLESHGTP